MSPTTMVFGFLFLGLNTSAKQVTKVVPATLIPLGIVILSSIIYIRYSLFFAKYLESKFNQTILSFLSASITWLILSSPFAIWKFSSLFLGIGGFFFLITITQFLINKNNSREKISPVLYKKKQIALRAFFTGLLIALVVFLSKVLNPFWGGVFAMFPVGTFASLTVLHFMYEPKLLYHFIRKAPLGSLSLFVYTISTIILFPRLGIVAGTVACYFISLAFSLFLIKMQTRIKNLDK